MYRLALDRNEKSLGKIHKKTKKCAGNLAELLLEQGRMGDLQKFLNVYGIEYVPNFDADFDGEEEDEDEDDKEEENGSDDEEEGGD